MEEFIVASKIRKNNGRKPEYLGKCKKCHEDIYDTDGEASVINDYGDIICGKCSSKD